MSLIQLMVVIIVIGVALWLVNAYLPMQPPWKTVLNVVVLIVFLLWLLSAVGLLGPLNQPITR
jgi:hypothetical protein